MEGVSSLQAALAVERRDFQFDEGKDRIRPHHRRLLVS